MNKIIIFLVRYVNSMQKITDVYLCHYTVMFTCVARKFVNKVDELRPPFRKAFIIRSNTTMFQMFIKLYFFYLIQSNLAIRNFLVALKLFLNTKSSLSLWSKWQIGHRKWFLNTNLFLIKPFLIAKFDCTRK